MRQTSIASPSGRDKRRAFIDRWVRMTVTSGGLLVLLTLMLIFVYLLYAVLPLFKPVSIRLDNQFVVKRNAPALALGMDIQGKIAYRIDNQGKGVFIRLGGQGSAPAGSVINEQALSAPPVSWSRAIGGQPLYGAGLSNGRFTLLQPDFLPPRLAGNFHWAINRVRSIYKASACCIWRWQSRNHSNFPLLPLPMIAACWWGNSPRRGSR